jgi:lipopolysaccharide export LptBFGC system permease protein LptF
MDRTNNNNNHEGDSTDDDLPNQNNKPVNLPTTITRRHLNNDHLRQQGDSGIELDQTSSSSTIYNQGNTQDQLLFPPSNGNFDESSQPSLLRHVQKQTVLENDNIRVQQNQLSSTITNLNQSDVYWYRLKQKLFRSLLLGLLILLILFLIYLFGLDRCSRSTIILSVFQKIICIENEGLPTI